MSFQACDEQFRLLLWGRLDPFQSQHLAAGNHLSAYNSNLRWVASQASRIAQEEFIARLIPSEFNRLFRIVKPITMVSYARLRNLHEATKYAVTNGIPGDIVECGVARGGSGAMIALTLMALCANREVWLFDICTGIPEPSPENPDYPIAKRYTGMFRASPQEVRSSLDLRGIGSNVHIVPGLFRDTLPLCPIKSISLLHVDGDWYESVRVCLESMYDRVSPGGIIQFDDYGHWAGARKAIDEFCSSGQIRANLVKLDFSGRQMKKAS